MNFLKNNIKAVTLFILMFFVIFTVVGCEDFEDKNADTISIGVYFFNPLTNNIESEKRTIQTGTETEMLENVIKEFSAGPISTNLKSVLKNDVKILKCNLQKEADNTNTAEVVFSDEYSELSQSNSIFCNAAVVWTLTELDFVDNVKFYVDDKPIFRTNGQELGLLNRDNVSINPVISPYNTDEKTIVLYFADEQGLGLVSEERRIEVKQSQTLETQIVEQIILGPQTENLYATVPSETKINAIKTEEGICYVNLSNDFVSNHNGGSIGETMTIYSIVNSLTDSKNLKNVKQVQFLIDGEKVTEFKGHFDFSKPFERNESIILKND